MVQNNNKKELPIVLITNLIAFFIKKRFMDAGLNGSKIEN